jgi:hypothetical protein
MCCGLWLAQGVVADNKNTCVEASRTGRFQGLSVRASCSHRYDLMWLLEMQRVGLINVIQCTTDLNMGFDVRSSNGSGCCCGCGRRKKKQGS